MSPHPTPPAPLSVAAPPSSPGVTRPVEDVAMAVLGLVMVGGVYLDGWAHLRGGVETFFTPWHALLYTGFAVFVAALVGLGLRDRLPLARHGWLALPAGYRPAGVGAVVFAVGGAADLGWHVLFGVEAGVDALVSPTHLVLLVGGLGMVSAPARSVGRRAAEARGPARIALVVSVAATAALAGFFLSYLSVFPDPAARQPLTSLPEGAPGHEAAELPAVAGFGAYLVTTAVLIVPMLVMTSRTRTPPAGLPSAVVAVVGGLGAGLTGYTYLVPVLAAVAGAAAAELLVRAAPVGRYSSRTLLVTTLPPLVWAGQLAALAATAGIGWNPALWVGALVASALVGYTTSLLDHDTPRPASPPHPDGTMPTASASP